MTNERNYQIDFLKLLLAICVFFHHTTAFLAEENTALLNLGWWAVHMFFVVSGLFLALSLMQKTTPPETAGRDSLVYVLGRVRKIIAEYWAAIIIFIIAVFAVCDLDAMDRLNIVVDNIPNMLFMKSVGLNTTSFSPEVVWYLSALFITMLPLCYLFKRSRTFTVYVFAPFAALILYGYFFSVGDLTPPIGNIKSDLLRALCGMCFGFVSWIIYDKLCAAQLSIRGKLALTITEILLYAAIIYALFFVGDSKQLNVQFAVMLATPLVTAIAMSRKSYVSLLFRAGFMKCFEKLSLDIYLMHFVAWTIVFNKLRMNSYWANVCVMAGLTIILCVVIRLITGFLGRLIGKNKKSPAVKAAKQNT